MDLSFVFRLQGSDNSILYGCCVLVEELVQKLSGLLSLISDKQPSYTSIAQHAKNGKPATVFVPTRKHVRLTAVDLITYSVADSGEKLFLLRSVEELEPFIDKISDEMLKVTLREGVGYLHEGLNSLDHDIVSQLFEAGWIQVCVLNSSMCWGSDLVRSSGSCDGHTIL